MFVVVVVVVEVVEEVVVVVDEVEVELDVGVDDVVGKVGVAGVGYVVQIEHDEVTYFVATLGTAGGTCPYR